MLPTPTQFRKAQYHLQEASNLTLCHEVLTHHNRGTNLYGEWAIENLQKAVAILGYELIERVTPAARDGGRMDVEMEDDDA